MLRITHCLENRLIDGGKFASPKHRPRSTLKYNFSASGTHFCSRPSKPQELVWPEELGKFRKKSFNSSGLEHTTFCP
jgi:hypothetical protein